MRIKFVYLLLLFFYFSFISIGNAQSNYVVLEGDTLWKIALKHEISLEQIIRSNQQLENPNLIYPGQIIVIPSAEWNDGQKSILTKEENKFVELLNRKRSQIGMKPLAMDDSLTKAAKLKSVDMIENNYISHHSPTYGSPSTMLKEFNISFRSVKENIGVGDRSADVLFSAWLNSSTNRAILLNELATKIGVGYAKGGPYGHYWTVLVVED